MRRFRGICHVKVLKLQPAGPELRVGANGHVRTCGSGGVDAGSLVNSRNVLSVQVGVVWRLPLRGDGGFRVVGVRYYCRHYSYYYCCRAVSFVKASVCGACCFVFFCSSHWSSEFADAFPVVRSNYRFPGFHHRRKNDKSVYLGAGFGG